MIAKMRRDRRPTGLIEAGPSVGQNDRAAPAATTGHGAAAPVTNAYRAAWASLRGPLAMAAFFSALVNILMLTGSLYMLEVYDRVLGSGSLPTLAGLFVIVTMMYAFLAYYDFLRARILSGIASRLDRTVGPTAFRAWLRGGLDPKGADSQPLRELDHVRAFLSGPAVNGLFDLPWMPFYLAVLYLVHPWLLWLTIAGAGVIAIIAAVNRRVSAQAIARTSGFDLAERRFAERAQSLAGALLPMGMESALTSRWLGLHDATRTAARAGAGASEGLAASSRTFRMFLQSVTLTIGAWLVLRGEISGGMIIASTILAGRALAPLDQVIGHWRTIGRAGEAHRRLIAFFDAEAARDAAAIDLPAPTGRIEVADLTKHAPRRDSGTSPPILSRVSFALDPGDGLGVIGNSAAGKSTLARLLVGAWEPDAGEVRFDGATRAQWQPDRLGRSIGYLPQSVDLLPGTVRDNIARFDPDATSEEVIEAAEMAGVHDMILSLPQGYATEVGGADSPLSGGQVQRIGLARALYGRPSIVVLDEPNSNLDADGDAALTKAVLGLRARGAAVVVMAHRPSALASVNKIMVLQTGMLVAFGPKEDVLGPSPAIVTANAPAPARLAERAPASLTRQATDDPSEAADAPTPEMAEADAAAVPERQVPAARAPGPMILDKPLARNLGRSRHPVFSRWRA